MIVVAGVGGIAIVGFLVFAFTVILGDKKPVEVVQTESARPAVPDAIEEKLITDKDKAYASAYSKESQDKSIEDIWSSLASSDISEQGTGSSGESFSETVFGIDAEGKVVDERPEEVRSTVRGKRRDSSSGSTASGELIVSRSSSASSSASQKTAKPAQKPKTAAAKSNPEVQPESVPEKTVEIEKNTRPQRTTGWNNTTSGVISSLDDDSSFDGNWNDVPDEKFIKCCFAKDYKLKNGTRITIRLLENLYLDEVVIPANTRIAAMCNISDRLNITISGFELNGRIYNANYAAFDMKDGKQGIYCSRADDQASKRVKREALNQGASATRDVLSYGGTLGALASDAIGIAQSVGNQEIQQTVVDIPAGFEFYIKKSKR